MFDFVSYFLARYKNGNNASVFVYTEGEATVNWESIYFAYQATRCGNEGGTGLEAPLSL